MPAEELRLVYEMPAPAAPAVSVVIPAYNSSEFIAKTLDSVTAQTFRDFEIIIVDDGSPRDTSEAAAAYMREKNLPGKVIRQPNAGIAGARNTGMAAASGQYIALLDHDDFWYPEKLARVIDIFAANPSIGLVTHDVDITRDDKVIRKYVCGANTKNVTDYLLFEDNLLTPSSTVFTREAAFKIAGFRENPEFCSVEDYDFWIRLSEVTGFYFLHETLGSYTHLESGASKRVDRHVGNLEILLKGHFAAMYPDGAPKPVQKRIDRRMAAVQRIWAKELLKSGAGSAATAEHVRAMNSMYPFYWKNAAVTLWCLLKKITGK